MNLIAADPTCWYCGCDIYYEYSTDIRVSRRPDFATIEHLFSRSHGRSRPDVGSRVLACRECNLFRNTISFLMRQDGSQRPEPASPSRP